MEVKREALGAGSTGDFRARQLRARDMLRGELARAEVAVGPVAELLALHLHSSAPLLQT